MEIEPLRGIIRGINKALVMTLLAGALMNTSCYRYDDSQIKQSIAQLEQELLAAINELGIGPQGFGGRTTCLGLAIEQMPTHVAGLPAAVNVSCHVTRRASAEL